MISNLFLRITEKNSMRKTTNKICKSMQYYLIFQTNIILSKNKKKKKKIHVEIYFKFFQVLSRNLEYVNNLKVCCHFDLISP